MQKIPFNNLLKKDIPSPFRDCLAHLKKEPSTMEFRGETYPFVNQYYVCEESGIEFIDSSIEASNLNQVYDQYRLKYDIPLAAEIVDYRRKNNLSETEMDKILEFESGTIQRFELGEVPSLEIGKRLRDIIGKNRSEL